MNRTFRNFVAILLAIWLPLFSGAAFASSVAMQNMSGDCEKMSMLDIGTLPASSLHHDYAVGSHDITDGQHDQENSPCSNHSVCHFACIGYLVTVVVNETAVQQFASVYSNAATQFQSYISALLDPPPLARV